MIPDNVQPVETDKQHLLRVHPAERFRGRLLVVLEALQPLVFGNLQVLVVPERLEHVPVVDEQANGTREVVPDQLVDELFLVQRDQLPEKHQEQPALRERRPVRNLVRVRGIEGNPQEDELAVRVVNGSARLNQLNALCVRRPSDSGNPSLISRCLAFSAW